MLYSDLLLALKREPFARVLIRSASAVSTAGRFHEVVQATANRPHAVFTVP